MNSDGAKQDPTKDAPARPTGAYPTSATGDPSQSVPMAGHSPMAVNPYGSSALTPYNSAYGSGYGSAYGSNYGTGYGSNYGSAYGASPYSSYNSYSSPYSSFNTSPYSSPYSSFNTSPYSSAYTPGLPFNTQPPAVFEQTHSAFQTLDQIVQAFRSLAHMLESTYFATHSTCMAFLGLASQFGYLTQHTDFSGEFKRQKRRWPLFVFLVLVFGVPYLMQRWSRTLRGSGMAAGRVQDGHLRQEGNVGGERQGGNGERKIQFARALFDFSAQQPQEVSFKKGDVLAVVQLDAGSEWWRGKVRHGPIGWFPSSHVALIDVPSGNSNATTHGSSGTGASVTDIKLSDANAMQKEE